MGYMKGGMGGMYSGSGRYSPRMMGGNYGGNSPRMMMGGGSPYNNRSGSTSPRNYGSPYNNFSGNDYNQMGSYRPGSAQHQQMGGMSGEHWKYNKPGYGSPYGSPRGSMNNMPHGSMA